MGDASSLKKNIWLKIKTFLCHNTMYNRQYELLLLESNQTLISFVFSVGWETRMLNWCLSSDSSHQSLMSAQLLLETFVPLTNCIHLHQYQHMAPAVRHLLHETTLVLSIEEKSFTRFKYLFSFQTLCWLWPPHVANCCDESLDGKSLVLPVMQAL